MPKGGRPFGENTNSGKGLMTAYTRGFTGSRTLKVSGKKATSNGRKLMKGQAARTKGWRSSP
jgi:uncharacterized Zn-binding protein involved in type VI secretion